MKLYEICFDYKREAEDVISEYVGSSWETELDNFKKIYNPEEDFMKQLSQHNLFYLVCMLDLNDDDYIEKCYEIHSELH
jgi:hypothetical protein